ncbi:MAG: diaminopimelate epimerase [Euryarchaeota archaeon]|nr:diaminopimelate epimerase [Euryarchaeota archaeon]
MAMKFYKYQGTGNDFILVENLRGEIPEEDKAPMARRLCERRFGIGGDGLLLVEPSTVAPVRMRIFNPDGSEAEMCGNGVRCFARHVYERHLAGGAEIAIETLAGVKRVIIRLEDGKVAGVRVEMGRPRDVVLEERLEVGGKEMILSHLDMGVPHAVVLVEDLEEADVEGLGREIRHHPFFPKGTNVNFLQRLGERAFRVRTYERGVEGETMACGTGTSACGVVASLLYLPDGGGMEIRTRGGPLRVEVAKGAGGVERVFMEGPAELVFEGTIP